MVSSIRLAGTISNQTITVPLRESGILGPERSRRHRERIKDVKVELKHLVSSYAMLLFTNDVIEEAL